MRKTLLACLVLIQVLIMCGCMPSPSMEKTESLSTVVREMDPENPEHSFGADEKAYQMGYNQDGMPVFIDTDKAFEQFVKDCAKGITILQEEYNLKPITKEYWYPYKNLGCQYLTEGNQIHPETDKVSIFFDYYENSFELLHPELY